MANFSSIIKLLIRNHCKRIKILLCFPAGTGNFIGLSFGHKIVSIFKPYLPGWLAMLYVLLPTGLRPLSYRVSTA
jgi:hypothetical protein